MDFCQSVGIIVGDNISSHVMLQSNIIAKLVPLWFQYQAASSKLDFGSLA